MITLTQQLIYSFSFEYIQINYFCIIFIVMTTNEFILCYSPICSSSNSFILSVSHMVFEYIQINYFLYHIHCYDYERVHIMLFSHLQLQQLIYSFSFSHGFRVYTNQLFLYHIHCYDYKRVHYAILPFAAPVLLSVIVIIVIQQFISNFK